MRKKIVFFLIIPIVLILNIYIPVSAEAPALSVHLPPPPSGVTNFVVLYIPCENKYRLASTEYDGNIYMRSSLWDDEHPLQSYSSLYQSDGNFVLFSDMYQFEDGAWVTHPRNGTVDGVYETLESANTGPVNEGKCVVYSSNNIYGLQGQLLSAGVSDGVLSNGLTLVAGGTVSSSIITRHVFYEILALVPYILPVCLIIIGIYKALGFLTGIIRGM